MGGEHEGCGIEAQCGQPCSPHQQHGGPADQDRPEHCIERDDDPLGEQNGDPTVRRDAGQDHNRQSQTGKSNQLDEEASGEARLPTCRRDRPRFRRPRCPTFLVRRGRPWSATAASLRLHRFAFGHETLRTRARWGADALAPPQSARSRRTFHATSHGASIDSKSFTELEDTLVFAGCDDLRRMNRGRGRGQGHAVAFQA